MRRVMIVGSPGAGKSTLALQIAARRGLPVVHLDRLHWSAGWVEPPADVWRSRVESAAAAESWIIDGNYGGTFGIRMRRADLIVWLDFDRRLCLLRALLRVALLHGRTRPDMAEGCRERFDLAFVKYIWSFPTEGRPRIVEALARHAGDAGVVILRTPRQARQFLSEL